jgi:hypothetical protein
MPEQARELDAESCLSKAITIVALTCVLIVGAAATSILGRDSVPAATAGMSALPAPLPATNRAGKADRLDIPAVALASADPAQTVDVTAPLRQAFAAATAADIPMAKPAEPDVPTSAVAPPKPKVTAKPQPQKSYALLSDGQIAGIKERLKLSSSQEYYWPAVEGALRAVARKIHANRLSNPNGVAVPIDADSEEIQQLKSAAMPLLFQLRDDQKEEVRKLARIIGLEKVAQQI